MSVATQLVYNALNTVKEYCDNTYDCYSCPFQELICSNVPQDYQVDKITDLIESIRDKKGG